MVEARVLAGVFFVAFDLAFGARFVVALVFAFGFRFVAGFALVFATVFFRFAAIVPSNSLCHVKLIKIERERYQNITFSPSDILNK